MRDIRLRDFRQPLAYFLLASCLVLYGLQLRSLYDVPVADSVRWGGDETWLMREFGHQVTHGSMQYPEIFGGAPRTDGVLAGSMWVDALLYGGAGQIFFPATDLVSTGRTVTAILGFTLLIGFYLVGRKLGLPPMLGAAGILVIISNQGFVWATHSARYDILTGLALLGYIYFLSRHIEHRDLSRSQWFLIGIASVSVIIFSRHLLTLAAPATLLYLIKQRVWRYARAAISYVSGLLTAAVLLCLAYWLGSGEFSLFGRGGDMGSYGFVLRQIPIMRPFSRNVQTSNLLERTNLFWTDARGVLYLILVAGLIVLFYKVYQLVIRRRGDTLRIPTESAQRFVVSAVALATLSWLLLQGSRPYYLYHVVPSLVLAGAIIYHWLDSVLKSYRYGRYTGTILLIAGVTFQAAHAIPDRAFGSFIAHDQEKAVTKFMAEIRPSTGRRILVDVAGLNLALQHTGQRVLTLDMFQPPPDSMAAVVKLRANSIEYAILRSSPVSTPFEPGRALLPSVLKSIGVEQDSAVGFFYDDGRKYNANLGVMMAQGLDTLKLYRILPAR